MIKQAPTISYPGTKWKLADWIISYMPEHKVYLEPFCGSAAVFFSKLPAALETINDINGHVVNLFRVMREDPEELASAVALTPWSRQENELSYDRDLSVLDPVESARRFLVRTWQGHGSANGQHRNGWRVVRDEEKGPRRTPYRQWQGLPDRVLAAAERLKSAQIECRPAVDVIKAFNQPGVLIYADPPYPSSTLSASRRGRKVYDDQMTDDEHAELLYTLDRHQGPVLISGYEHPLYEELETISGGAWIKVSKRTYAEKAQKRTECLWINPVAQYKLEERLF